MNSHFTTEMDYLHFDKSIVHDTSRYIQLADVYSYVVQFVCFSKPE